MNPRNLGNAFGYDNIICTKAISLDFGHRYIANLLGNCNIGKELASVI